jgi:hypothetical protein
MRADKLADQLSNLEPHTELPEEQWREIEMAIGILEPNKLFRCRIEHCVELAFALAGSDPPSFGEVDGPKRTVVRPELKKLKSDAKRLADRLSRLQAKAMVAALQAGGMLAQGASTRSVISFYRSRVQENVRRLTQKPPLLRHAKQKLLDGLKAFRVMTSRNGINKV